MIYSSLCVCVCVCVCVCGGGLRGGRTLKIMTCRYFVSVMGT